MYTKCLPVFQRKVLLATLTENTEQMFETVHQIDFFALSVSHKMLIILGCKESFCGISNFDFKLCIFKQVFVVFLYCIYHFKKRFLHFLMVIILIVLKKLCFFCRLLNQK